MTDHLIVVRKSIIKATATPGVPYNHLSSAKASLDVPCDSTIGHNS